MSDPLYIAIDLGAGSGRIFLAGLAAGEFMLEEMRRFHYPPLRQDGHLRWDVELIFDEIKLGLRAAGERATQLSRTVASIGVDTWAVDYGLIDSDGELIEKPVCYRDERTQGMIDAVTSIISHDEIYARTGIQFMNFNTLFQLVAYQREGIPDRADSLLLIPDLINYWLTGVKATEYTNATTMQLVKAESRTWDDAIIARLDLPRRLFTEIVSPGTVIGRLKPRLAKEFSLRDVVVVAPATHDTGSAVAGAPLQEGWAYISSGTWSLVGVELAGPLINLETARHNFSNEGGVFGTIRFLKNVAGLWLLESCRKEWQERGISVGYEDLLARVAERGAIGPFIFPDDPRFFNPVSMTAAITAQLADTGQSIGDEPAVVAGVILNSMACRYASIIRTIETLTANPVWGIQIVGGGSLNGYLNQAAANATGKAVAAGPREATVIGNLLVQAIADGRFSNLDEARRHVSANLNIPRFEPATSSEWKDAVGSYAEVEARYSDGSTIRYNPFPSE